GGFHDLGGFERDGGIFLDVEKVLRFQVLVALGNVGVEAVDFDRAAGAPSVRLVRIEIDRAFEILERALRIRKNVAYLESDAGVFFVDLVGFRPNGGGQNKGK